MIITTPRLVVCSVCNKSRVLRDSVERKTNLCRNCWLKGLKPKTYKNRACEICRKEYTPTSASQKWCNRSCAECVPMKDYSSSGKSFIKLCVGCARSFKSYNHDRKFCSYPCFTQFRNNKRHTSICKQCNKEFQSPKSDTKRVRGTFCSRQCFSLYRIKRDLIACKNCSKVFESLPKKESKFCSRDCQYTYSRGKPHPSRKTETIKKVRAEGKWTGETEVWIKIKHRYPKKAIWKRKAVIVLEKLVGRQLSNQEHRGIVFLDGDRMNCAPDNLLLVPTKMLLVCKVCGNSRVEVASVSLRDREGCAACRTGWSPKISYRGISCIKTFLENRFDRKGNYYVKQILLAAWFCVGKSTIQNIKCGNTGKGVAAMAKKNLWKALLEQHDKLMKQSGVTLYDRVTLLAKVFEDPQFILDMKSGGESHVEELDKRVADTCANFTELLQVLKMFPQKRQWENGNLSDMRLKMLEKLRGEQATQKAKKGGTKKKENGRSNRRVATISQVNDLEEDIVRLKRELETSHKLLASYKAQIEGLQAALEDSRKTIAGLMEGIVKTTKKRAPRKR